MSGRFLNIHVVLSHSAACQNRDEMGLVKTLVFGGVRRARISSQSLKFAFRNSEYYKAEIGGRSIRTRHLSHLRQIMGSRFNGQYSPETLDIALDLLSGKNNASNSSFKKTAITPWVIDEVDEVCRLIERHRGLPHKELEKRIRAETVAIKAAASSIPDIALSGRMATSGLMTSIDGALSVAHSFTTHTMSGEMDWYTAVDDVTGVRSRSSRQLMSEDVSSLGSAHMDMQDFASGVFYRYGCINLSQLEANLGSGNRDDALGLASHVAHLFATVVPSTKQRSFASFDVADFLMVTFSDFPLSLANAFEVPVQPAEGTGGYTDTSIRSLLEHRYKIKKTYGYLDKGVFFSTNSIVQHPRVEQEYLKGLPQLNQWILSDGGKVG